MDKIYRNIRTGEVKPLPLNVYKAVKKNWEPVEDEETIIARYFSSVAAGYGEEVKQEPVETSVTVPDPSPVEQSEPSKESLQAEFEAIAGKKPDGRWNEKKLAEKIKELKENQ